MGTQELDGRARAPRRRRKYRLTFAHGTSRSPSRPVRAARGLPGDVRLTSVHQQPRPCALPVCPSARRWESGKVAAIGGLGGKGWLCSRCRYCRRGACSAALFGMRDAATMAMPEVTRRLCDASGLRVGEHWDFVCVSRRTVTLLRRVRDEFNGGDLHVHEPLTRPYWDHATTITTTQDSPRKRRLCPCPLNPLCMRQVDECQMAVSSNGGLITARVFLSSVPRVLK